MAAGKLLNAAEEASLVRTIGQVEEKTTGELRVHIARQLSKEGVIADARAAFTALHMHETDARNGILIYVVPSAHQVAVIGDEGIHEKVGPETWTQLVDWITSNFKKGDFLVGLQGAVEQAGALLEKYFPHDGEKNPNELSDDISRS